MKVDGYKITGQGPAGEEIEGLECSECGQLFFDQLSERTPKFVVEDAVEKFISHANDEHDSSGGIIGRVKPGVAAFFGDYSVPGEKCGESVGLVVSGGRMIGQLQGFVEYVGEITPLETQVQFTRYCPTCDREQIFIAGWQCESGLVGCCLGCGDERIAPFTRVNSEVA